MKQPTRDRPHPPEEERKEASLLDDLTHAEFLTLWRQSAENIRYAKSMQWSVLVYFTAICAIAVTIGVYLRWGDPTLIGFLFYLTWFFSISSVIMLISLQSWQAGEQRRIDFVTSKLASWTRKTLGIRSRLAGDFQRYAILGLMILYIEMTTFAVTRMMWPRF